MSLDTALLADDEYADYHEETDAVYDSFVGFNETDSNPDVALDSGMLTPTNTL